jgi:hypothetical protein
MIRFFQRERTLQIAVPLVLRGCNRTESTASSSRRGARKPKNKQTSPASSTASRSSIDNQAVSAAPSSQFKLSSFPSAPTKGPSWVRSALHYDAGKVQRLANLFTGAAEDNLTAIPENTSTKPYRTTSIVAKSVEEQLRDPLYQVKSKGSNSTGIKSAGASNRSQKFSARRHASSSSATVRAVRDAREEWSLIENWTSALLSSTNASVATVVKELLSIEGAVRQVLNDSSNNNTAAEQESLSAFLKDSRLHWQLTSTEAALFLLPVSGDGACGVRATHLLCLAASALEAGMRSFVKADKATTRTAAAADNSVADWRLRCGARYCQLLSKLLAALTMQLVKLNDPQHSLAVLQMRQDVLLSALMALLHASAISAAVCNRSGGSAALRETVEHPVATVTEHYALLVQLCVEVSRTVDLQCVASISLARAGVGSPEHNSPLQSYVRSASSLSKQLANLQSKLITISRSGVGHSCVQGVTSALFLFCVSILRIDVAAEGAALRAASEPPLAPESSAEQLQKSMSLLEKKIETPRPLLRSLTGEERVWLASHAEKLLGMLHPKPDMSCAALASMQHRTTSTPLSVLLASLWRYSVKVHGARALRVPTEASASLRSVPLSSNEGIKSDSSAFAATALVSSSSRFWERHPAHVALLLRSYVDLLTAVCSDLLPRVLQPVSAGSDSSSTSVDVAWVLPFASRVIRMGMSMQMDTTLLAAAHLDLEASAPRTPSTPLEKVVASRHKARLAAGAFSRKGRKTGKEEPTPCDSGSTALPKSLSVEVRKDLSLDEGSTALWSRVLRLSGGLRVGCCETLYRAVVDLTSLCLQNPSVEERFVSHRGRPAVAAGRSGPPAVVLIEAVSRVLFCVPRTEYLLGLYTDDSLSADAAIEQSRRVYTACTGVFMWLRELSPSFGSHFTNTTSATPPAADAASAAQDARVWLVCGTSKANALEAAFFATYLLHHWPSIARSRHPPPQQLSQPRESHEQVHEYTSPLAQVLSADGSYYALAPAPVDSLLTPSTAEAYVAETLLHLQHDTAGLLRHLRTTDRFYHFSGEMKDKTKLMKEEALQRRHVASTLSVVVAYQKQPNFVWMPLEAVQEVVFELHNFPKLLTASETAASASSLLNPGENRVRDVSGASVSPDSGVREYAKVQVGSTTCTFARAHGYLVRRLHVLSGILREYRSMLLKSAASPSQEDEGEEKSPPTSTYSAAAPSFRASKSFYATLQANAAHSPNEEGHRRNNYNWAHPWALMLREDFARLPAEVEGTPRWGVGVLRVMERMELVMQDTYQQGLFINVVRTQQQYKLQKRVNAGSNNELHQNSMKAEKDDECVDYDEVKGRERPLMKQELRVTRASAFVPLGVVLDGKGYVLRVQERVSVPITGDLENAAAVAGSRMSHLDVEEVASPFAVALASASGGVVVPRHVMGGRVTAVDGVLVSGGREVATQVRDKVDFVLTIER